MIVEEAGFEFSIMNKSAKLLGFAPGVFFEEIEIPAYVQGKPVKTIEENAFKCSKIKIIRLPATITLIKDEAFADCRELQEVELEPNKNLYLPTLPIIILQDFVFKGCINLESVKFHKEVSYIGCYAFAGCVNLCEFPDSIRQIRKFAFKGCSALLGLLLSDNAYLYGDSIEYSGVRNLCCFGNVTAPNKVLNFLKKNNVSILCSQNSNLVDLIYNGINVVISKGD